MSRLFWFRLLLGLVLGLIFGLYYAWFVSPRQIHQSRPQDLSSDYQDEYRTLVASAYASTGDFSRSLTRLDLLSDPVTSAALDTLAQTHLAAGRSDEEVRALAQLASAIESGIDSDGPTQTPAPSATALIPITTSLPAATLPPTATPTPLPAFELQSLDVVCDPNLESPLIQVEVYNARGGGVPGVEISILWDQGEDHLFTGMKPELGLGYGDFSMDIGVTYTLQLVDAIESVTDIRSEECAMEEGGIFPSSVLLRFEEP
jgi:hypothetical protein